MDTTNYSLTKLWPEFSRLWAGDFTSPEGLSAVFIALLFALAIFFSVMSVINYFRASRHLRFYKRLLKGLTLEQLLDKRRELVNTALQNQTYGRLWREFDESLVHIPQKQRLCNTLDAGHFFNTHTISRGLTENRLLAAVPGFLTAIGVIGTFAGLQLGLGPLGALDPANAKVDDLTHGIFGMIGGASIAFMTSVWGVLISVLFNFFEKCLERNIRSAISSFQNEVDYLYPRITAEQSLSNIEDFTRQSNERLAVLDEKIGNKMQEAMKEASNVISDSVANSLNTILGPAIERLVDNAHSGSEKALETLLDRFLQGVGSAGDSQKAMMEQAAKEIAAASVGMTDGLNQFATKLDGQVNSMMQRNADVLNQVNGAVQQQLESQSQQEKQRQEQLSNSMADFMGGLKTQLSALAEQNAMTLKTVQGELSGQIAEQQSREAERQQRLQQQQEAQSQLEKQRQEQLTGSMADFMGSLKTQLSVLAEQNASTLKTVQGELSGQMEQQQGRELARQKQLQEQLSGFQAAQERVTQSIDNVLAVQQQQNTELLTGLRAVIDRFEQLSGSHQSATSAMQTVSAELKAGSNQLGLLSTNLKAAIETLGKQLLDAVEAADDVTKSNATTSEVFTQVLGSLQQAGDHITTASGTLNEAAGKAESGFIAVDKHFNTLAQSLQSHLTEVQQQVADLLSNYSDRVKDQTVARLNTWNEHTNNYISSMTDAVRTLSGVVDEIDGKVSRRNEGASV
ncbi:anti-phage ZorAB system protein ZorA [Rheinheimera maricola]|uniref:Anti-phage defense ZorAB system protein ZorA n=1 Tax=Rheinheimera maricola TaxID=2793282 RepID=A0ABS7X5N8_9GAMM|nr:anti-phage ZorAB system protein ZorA [Rheinheimera maricola]MBZ9610849.1 anti-phage defense ZorAB system protein ZorA [Rheinheimera maricola]